MFFLAILSYSTAVPIAYPYAYSAYPSHVAYSSHPAEDDGKYWPGKYEKAEVSIYNHEEDDGQYYPGKYEKAPLVAAYSHVQDDGQYYPDKYEKAPLAAAYNYPEDDGQYWPGKYEKASVPAYPVIYHH